MGELGHAAASPPRREMRYAGYTALAAAEELVAAPPQGLGEGKVKDSSSSALFKASYYRIPYFVLTHLATKAGKIGEEACKRSCDEKAYCKAFSWNKKTKECLWSLDSIDYDPEFDFFAKTNVKSGAPFTYYEFLGVKYQEPKAQKYANIGKQDCRSKCDKQAETCMSFSFRARDRTCFISGEGLHYDSAWDYYEKDVASVPAEWKKGSTKEIAKKQSFGGKKFTAMSKKTGKEAEKEVGKATLKKATKKKKKADAKVAKLKDKLAKALEKLKNAKSSAGKEVARLQVKAAKKALKGAQKKEAKAAIKSAATKAEVKGTVGKKGAKAEAKIAKKE